MDKLNAEQRKKNMQAVKSKGSAIEKLLGEQLWSLGLRYRKNDNSVLGKPDFTFKKHKIAVFVDGDFWHGKNWDNKKHDHKSNIEFWHQKIERNMIRDKEVTEKLITSGWTVFRFWGSDIKKNAAACARQVAEKVKINDSY